jgi:hypothetical protein
VDAPYPNQIIEKTENKPEVKPEVKDNEGNHGVATGDVVLS